MDELIESESESNDSLFGYSTDSSSVTPSGPAAKAQCPTVDPVSPTDVPPVPGLYLFRGQISEDKSRHFLRSIISEDIFHGGSLNQIMIFTSETSNHLPMFIQDLIDLLCTSLRDQLPPDVYAKCFDPQGQQAKTAAHEPLVDGSPDRNRQPFRALARQVILNLYSAPTSETSGTESQDRGDRKDAGRTASYGIKSHIDLPHRYADGIVGASFGWGEGVVMDFERDERRQSEVHADGAAPHTPNGADEKDDPTSDGPARLTGHQCSVWIPNRSVYILSGPARWDWKHGIADRDHDLLLLDENDGDRMILPEGANQERGSDPAGQATGEVQPDLLRDFAQGETGRPRVRRVDRDIRVSVTLRWLKPDGDVLSVLA